MAQPDTSCARSTSADPIESDPCASDLDFSAVLDQCDPITLGEMDSVSLQDRTDTKYVMTTRQLYDALQALGHRYRVLEIGDTRLHPYRSVYFDTPNFDLYMHHHAGRYNRFKVRSRQYVGTGLSFFEVKHKTNKDRTKKSRFRTEGLLTSVNERARDFVDEIPVDLDALGPRLTNGFSRVTLVSKHASERLTLDLDVRFATDCGSNVVHLPGLAIAEVKQDGIDRNSDFIRHMRSIGVREMSFSKYCIGVSMVYSGVKHNRFKRKLDIVHRLTHPELHQDA